MLSRDPIDPDTLDKARFQIELETLAYDPSKKATHRMRLPAVAFVSAAMVAPPGERSISIAADCFVPDWTAAPPCWASVGCSMVQQISPEFASLLSLSSGSPSFSCSLPAAPPKPRKSS
jgi:hypothetical protein